MKQSSDSNSDVERDAIDETHLTNNDVQSLVWQKVQVELRSWKSDLRPKSILSNIDGYAQAGTKSSS